MNNVISFPTREPDPVLVYDVGGYRVFRMDHNDAESMGYLDRIAERSLAFCRNYHAETDPQWLINVLYGNFRQKTGLICVIVVLDKEDNIVGHAIAEVEQYQRLVVATVIQIEIDKLYDPITGTTKPNPMSKQIWETSEMLLTNWRDSLKIKTFLAYSIPGARQRLYEGRGWKSFRVLMRKDAPE